MGSLPNLHELNSEESVGIPAYKPGPALGHLCGGNNPTLTPEEKSRILHRYSGHARITKARSNPHDPSKIVYDDLMLEHMATYSPISSRSTRNLSHVIRRRDSMNSSIGATSVRRLIATVVRGGPNSKSAPIHTRKTLIRNLAILCLVNTLITATFLPFLALQTSVSVWTIPLQNQMLPINVNIGSLLLSLAYFFAAISSLLGPAIVSKIGANTVVIISSVVFALFYLSHLYPALYVLVPFAVVFGVTLGPLSSACITFVMTLSLKITNLFGDEEEDNRILRRTCIIRRVARAFRAGHDFGLIFGSVLTSILISYTTNLNHFHSSSDNNGTLFTSDNPVVAPLNVTAENCSTCADLYDYNGFLDEIFDTFEGARLCGAQACPSSFLISFNSSEESFYRVLPNRSSTVIACCYAGACVVAGLLAALLLDKFRVLVYQDPLERSEGLAALRAVRDTFRDIRLQMAAPLAVFIGIEQAFIFADFSKSYVVCTLGIHRLNLVFLAMGVLQSIAACTLSMLLRTIRRYYVVAVGFTFHACLVMVLILWKPTEDDPALFYVISASWGVCNAIWEMLNFTLLTGLFPDNWEAPFANATFFKCVGLSIAFGLHGFLCNYVKLYSLAFALLSVIPFAYLEMKLENMRKVKNITRL